MCVSTKAVKNKKGSRPQATTQTDEEEEGKEEGRTPRRGVGTGHKQLQECRMKGEAGHAESPSPAPPLRRLSAVLPALT